MKCLILAAGYATRLYPLTESFPKPLLKVRGKSILDWLLDDLAESRAAEDYIVVSNHRFAPHFQRWADEHPFPILVLDDGTDTNETRLGAVCDILFAIDKLHLDDDLLIAAGDNLLDFSLDVLLRYAREKKSSCFMRYFEADEQRLRKCGVAQVAADDRLLSLEEKPSRPKSNWCIPPFYFYVREDVQKIRRAVIDGCGTDAPGSLAAWMCRHSTVYSMEMPGRRYDIGNLASYEEAQSSYPGILRERT